MRRMTISVLLAFVFGAASPAIAGSTSDWSGHWTGVAVDSGPHYRIERPIELSITASADGLTLVDQDRMRGDNVPAALHIDGRHVSATYQGLWPTPIRIEGTLSQDGKNLAITMRGDGMTGLEVHMANLHRDDPATLRYGTPRIDTAGKPVTTYSYHEPAAGKDGIAVATPEAVGLKRASLEALVRSVLTETGARDAHQTESILVLRHGKLVLEEYFWGQTADNPHIISSATKSVTSIIAGIAYDRGQLALDKPVAEYFPDRTDTLWVKDHYPITVRNIMAMSSGTDFDKTPSGPNSFGLLATHDVTSFALNVPAAHPAGSVFNYDNGLPSLMGALLTKATSTPYAELADKGLFAPLGINDYRWTDLQEGMPLSAGGLYLRSRDMAKLGQMMLDRGTWHGKRIVSEAWIAESIRKQTAPGQYPYGFYWHLNNEEKRRVADWDGYFAIGQGGQIIGIFPAEDIVIVMTSADWAKSTPRSALDEPFTLMSRYIVPSLTTPPPPAAQTSR